MDDEDLYYEEYLQRRNVELQGRREKGEFPKAPTPAPPKEKAKLKPRRVENAGYVPEGYVQKETFIGEDPLTSLRTMKTNLRRKQIDAARRGYEVKAQLCQSACEELAKAEVKLVDLHSLRSKAIFNGELDEAARIAAQMREVKNSALHDGYADLLMDANQLEAFGVESKWTPDVTKEEEAEEEERRMRIDESASKKNEEEPIREVRSFSARRRERDSVEPKKERETPKTARKDSSKERRPPSTKSNRPKSVERAPTPKKEIKRNQRLKTWDEGEAQQMPKEAPKNDPFGLPVDYGKCKFCGEEGPELGRESLLKLHYAERCPVVHRCTYCDRAVEVSQLTDHQLNRCDFAKDALVMCSLCGLAKDRHDDDHPLCRKEFAPRGSSWCPLCSVAVTEWKKHLTTDCYNNPRKGLSGVPPPAPNGAPNFMQSVDKLTESVAKFAKGGSARRRQNRTPSRYPSRLPSGRPSGVPPTAAPRRQPSPAPSRSMTPLTPPPRRQESPEQPRRTETPQQRVETPKPPPQKFTPVTPEQVREAYRKMKEKEEKEKEKETASS